MDTAAATHPLAKPGPCDEATQLDFGREGFIRRTWGGFYRAYSYREHAGVGPFFSRDAAIDWIETGKYVHPAQARGGEKVQG